MKRINISASVIALSLLTLQFSSCNDFLDTMPDNRAEIDSELKVKTLLTSAYPTNSYVFITEVMSDNVDDTGEESPYTDRFFDEVYAWKDLTETNNDDTERFWNASYRAIAAANHALEAIDKMGGPRTSTLTTTSCWSIYSARTTMQRPVPRIWAYRMPRSRRLLFSRSMIEAQWLKTIN